MDTTLALATVVLAIVTAAMAVFTFMLAFESKKASYRQIGVQTWLEMQKRWDSEEMLAARRETAQQLLRSDPHKDISETVMNFFEDVGTLYRTEYIDKKLATSTFGYFVTRWWKASGKYIYEERTRHNDTSLFSDFKHFAHDMIDPCDSFPEEKIKEFLEREADAPIDLAIEVLKSDECNRHLDLEVNVQTYCHHLRVRNLTPNKTIQNCHVWLKGIVIINESIAGKPNERIVFAVPQLMEWAPSEYSRDKRTFIKDQIFDLGKTYHNPFPNAPSFPYNQPEGFIFTIERLQGASRNLLQKYADRFIPGATLECVVYATADNYHEQNEFKFRILVKPIKHNPGAERVYEGSEITPVKRPT